MKAPVTHFVVHGEQAIRKQYARRKFAGHRRRMHAVRALCGKVVAHSDAKALREDALCECGGCMVIKDFWLQIPRRKPLTIRRVRALKVLMRGAR